MTTPLPKELKPIKAQPGRPLYLSVRDAVREAIEAGVFTPGEQIPSTKHLSEQLAVSLVTAHRALQELVSSGVLERSQGRGTFVHHRFRDRNFSGARVGLVLHAEASLCDLYHSQILEGIRQAARQLAVDLVLLRYGEDVRNECDGFLFVNPLPEQIDQHVTQSKRKATLVVGARSHSKLLRSLNVDNFDIGRQAVTHLAELGHRNIGYVGGDERISNHHDRWEGFLSACDELGIVPREQHIIKGLSWQLDEHERSALSRALSKPDRPTAVFAAGFELALDVYDAAASAGLRLPGDLSVVGVDDPASAAHISPPLTTLRQPLVDLGSLALTSLVEHVHGAPSLPQRSTLRAEMIIRRSTAALVPQPGSAVA